MKNCVNISNIPLSILNSLTGYSNYYENIKIKLWDTRDISNIYLPKIIYEEDKRENEIITNILIGFNTYSILVYAPTDPQLETLYITVQKIFKQYERLVISKKALNSCTIDKIISENVNDLYIKRAFSYIHKELNNLEDMHCKKFMILKAFEIFCKII